MALYFFPRPPQSALEPRRGQKSEKTKKKKTQIIKKNKENTDLSTTGIGVGKSQSGTKIVKKIVTIDTDFREINQVYMALNLYTLHF